MWFAGDSLDFTRTRKGFPVRFFMMLLTLALSMSSALSDACPGSLELEYEELGFFQSLVRSPQYRLLHNGVLLGHVTARNDNRGNDLIGNLPFDTYKVEGAEARLAKKGGKRDPLSYYISLKWTRHPLATGTLRLKGRDDGSSLNIWLVPDMSETKATHLRVDFLAQHTEHEIACVAVFLSNEWGT